MGPFLVWETKIGDQNKSSVKVFFRKTTRTKSVLINLQKPCGVLSMKLHSFRLTERTGYHDYNKNNGQVKLRHVFSSLYWSWGGCWMVSELGSLKFTTINLLPAWWMLENTQKKTAPPHLFGQMSHHKFCNSKVFTNRRVFFTNHYHHGPNFTDRPQQTQTYSNTKQKWSIFRWLPGNCEPQTPKASFPSPLSSSVVAPPRAFL